jgi:hypothetical protein
VVNHLPQHTDIAGRSDVWFEQALSPPLVPLFGLGLKLIDWEESDFDIVQRLAAAAVVAHFFSGNHTPVAG